MIGCALPVTSISLISSVINTAFQIVNLKFVNRKYPLNLNMMIKGTNNSKKEHLENQNLLKSRTGSFML